MTAINHEDILFTIRQAALDAGEIIRNATPDKRINLGTFDDLVTPTDLETDKCIRDILRADFPSITIFSEETCKGNPSYQPSQLGSFTGFLVDPIDGSVNFTRTISPHYGNFAVSIGYCENGIPVVGLIYKPLENEIYHAIRGKGSFCNNEQIFVSTIDSIERAAIEVGSFWIRHKIELFQRWFSNADTDVSQILIRGSAAAALADVARGRIEAMLHSKLNAWDYCAGWVIVEEAGGLVMCENTSTLTLGSKSIYATNSLLNDKIIKIIRNEL